MIRLLLILLGIPAVFIFLMVQADRFVYREENRAQPFDLQKFHNAQITGVCGMVEDMQRTILKTGTSRKAVEHILGQPNGIMDNSYDSKHSISYEMGECAWSPIGGEFFLVITFDKDDKLLGSKLEGYD